MTKLKFLPINRAEMAERGWNELDFIMITGDAYIDHPSFGAAIITRLLEREGYKVGVIAQPDWKTLEPFRVLGKPRLAILITGGNLDSMVNHYTAAKKKRSQDAYAPGGKSGLRPDRATTVYSNRVREALPGVPVIIGGIEASLRRFSHYDYWSDQVRRSILLDSQADLLVFGMGETAVLEVAKRLHEGEPIASITDVRGTMIPWRGDPPEGALLIPPYAEVKESKKRYAEGFWLQYREQDPFRGNALYQEHGREGVLQNPPSFPLSEKEMDAVYELPYARTYHPVYEREGGVPALKEVEFSLTSSRGCHGSCSFCALTFHQGRIVQGRSADSIVREAEDLVLSPHFKGYIHDVGGPTANFRRAACKGQLKRGACAHRQCLFPEPCPELDVDHHEYIQLLRRLRGLPSVKKVFVRSGIRYDAVLADKKQAFLRELCKHHISGQLKVAPEHVSPAVLKRMGKPGRKVYDRFVEEYGRINKELGKKQYLVPYLMSSHPGSTLKEAVELAEYVRDLGVNPEQVQDFIPTPGTLSTCMYFTGLDPRTMEHVYVPRSPKEKAMQRALIQYRDPQNYDLVAEALRLAHREDLIGYGPKCLIRPRKGNSEEKSRKEQVRGKENKNSRPNARVKTKKSSEKKVDEKAQRIHTKRKGGKKQSRASKG